MRKTDKMILGVIAICGLFILIGLNNNQNNSPEEKMLEKMSIEGVYFALLLDGEEVNALPSAGTYLIDYTCDNNSKVEWNRTTGELSISKNSSVAENCVLTFKTNPLVSELEQGSYIAYEGNNGCLRNGTSVTGTSDAENGNSCLGYNANANIDGSRDADSGTYGYCYDANRKYYTSGWRIAYTDGGRAYIVSAGSPECKTRTSSIANVTYIAEANSNAKKYCNSSFVDDCTSDTDVHALNDTDFNKMTAQMTGTTGGYLFTVITGATACGQTYSKSLCGYNNDLIDIGGYYSFAAAYMASSTSNAGVSWTPLHRFIGVDHSTANTEAFGLRPVIRLSSDVYVTGGSGTPEDPYTIAK